MSGAVNSRSVDHNERELQYVDYRTLEGSNVDTVSYRTPIQYALWAYIVNNAIAWLVCLVCTYLLPQYDERFNIFHV